MEHAAQHSRPKRKAADNAVDAAGHNESPAVRWGDPNKAPQLLPPEAEELCEKFFQESISFATRFAELTGLTEEQAPAIQGMILSKCSEAIATAQLSALEAAKP